MKILFLGNDLNPISIRALEALLVATSHEVMVGFHQPAGGSAWRVARSTLRSQGVAFLARRGLDLTRATLRLRTRAFLPLRGYRSVRELLVSHAHVPCFTATDLNGDATLARIRAFGPDLVVVAAFSRILKRHLIEVPRLGCVNLHPSLLPGYRGPNPFFWVLHNGEKESGVTVHYIDEGIDTGDIILQEVMPIAVTETEQSLRDRSAVAGARLVLEAVAGIENGTAPRIAQRHEDASYYSHPPRGASRL